MKALYHSAICRDAIYRVRPHASINKSGRDKSRPYKGAFS